ncbi:FAD-dependent thymidylate synthase [Rhodococcus rhodnii]|uniref:Flavin-dependent thymidylate synthase n=2 Tax=Rhodococcus rhodnii TaxID=38312 RepID=R7WSN2_9NOCA|nr:FAD-dependent thymidylate synthase [Rhodococcus rhodnii]EOM77079.1 FAD-dependent thymidylate synthase [Rhodococcus rhodnii LMG 5362]TXG90887.1 FAD-dependent thymidylate synthase [Rhodococcus rhodnii]
MHAVPLEVRLIARTEFLPPDDVPWSTDADGGEALSEFAGRACYQSWSKPNPRTASNADYLRHLLAVGHDSVLEHASASFYITGMSRSCTHELIRHRHLSFSQLSQRFVRDDQAAVVVPPAIAGDAVLEALFEKATTAAHDAYRELLDALEEALGDDVAPALRGRLTRQAARAVLPNATETRVVASGNYRAWRHFVAMRATPHADLEIRRVAIAVLRELQTLAPSVFGDFVIERDGDGTETATSEFGDM